MVNLKAPQDPGESALKVLCLLPWPRQRWRKGKERRGQETRESMGQSLGMPTEAVADFSQFGESWEDNQFPMGRTSWEPGIFVYESWRIKKIDKKNQYISKIINNQIKKKYMNE